MGSVSTTSRSHFYEDTRLDIAVSSVKGVMAKNENKHPLSDLVN